LGEKKNGERNAERKTEKGLYLLRSGFIRRLLWGPIRGGWVILCSGGVCIPGDGLGIPDGWY
jgi:hypothetical protein